MHRVTVLLTGVPQYVTLTDLSYNLDRLFNTDEIGTFKIRDLPNHHLTNKRQIALDFGTGFDAMAAQEKLDGYQYELVNGREYTLHAKITQLEEYIRSESQSAERWNVNDWPLGMIANMSDGDMYRAHAKLDAQLELLKKQKLILETEKEILREKRKLKQEYCGMDEDSENDASTSKRSRSRERRSSCSHTRSRSREHRSTSREHRSTSKPKRTRWSRELTLRTNGSRDVRSCSKDRGSNLPQIEWHHVRASKARELRSHSKERLSRSRETRSKEHRSRSRDSRKVCLRIRPWEDQERSRSNERTHRSWRNPSREREHGHRSRSTSKEPSHLVRRPEDSHGEDQTPPIKNKSILIDSGKNKHGFEEVDRDDAKNNGHTECTLNDVEGDAALYTKENKICKHKQRKDADAKKKIDKYNIKVMKADKLVARVESIKKDIMVVMLMLLDEIINKCDITIPETNRKLLHKRLEALIEERVEPLARFKNNRVDDVLKKYKLIFTKDDDEAMLRSMLADIPKVVSKIPQPTVTLAESVKDTSVYVAATDTSNDGPQRHFNTDTNCVEQKSKKQLIEQEPNSGSANSQRSSGFIEIIDVLSNNPSETIKNNDINEINLAPLKNNQVTSPDNKIEIKKEEVVATIDLDTAEKPVPRRPMFVLVIRKLSKDINKVIRNNKLEEDIKLADLKHALRYIIRDLVKGQGYMTRADIIQKFRGIYPENKDLQFVKNVIKDIKDGKYPGLGPNVDAVENAAENECEDDVILLEKKIDVVTVADSDDDDGVTKPKKIIDLKCEPVQPITINEPGSTETLSNSTMVTAGPVNPLPAPTPNPLEPNLGNPSAHMPCLSNPNETDRCYPLTMAKTLPVNRGLDMPNLYEFGSDKPDQATTNPAQPNLNPAMHVLKNAHPANHHVANPILPDLHPANPGRENVKFVGVNACPARSAEASLEPIYNAPANVDPVRHSLVYTGPRNPGPVIILPAYFNPTTLALLTNHAPSNPVLAMQGLPSPAPVNQSPANPVQAKLAPAKPGSADQKSMWQNIQKLPMTDFQQQLQIDEIQESTEKDKNSEKENSQSSNEVSAKDNQKEVTEENNSDTLKVTGITIMTSVNELIARTLTDETEKTIDNKVVVENIKEEIDLEDTEESKELDSDKGPQVTSITIMTSEAELFSLSNDDGEINVIKTETILDNNAERSGIIISNNETGPVQSNSAVTELRQTIARSETQNLPLDKSPDEEDETIESIVKFVNSFNY